MNYCFFCNTCVAPASAESTTKLFGKVVCTNPECEGKAKKEADEAAESLMTPRDRVIAYLHRNNFVEQSTAKGLFIQDGTTQIAVDLTGITPRIGAMINGEIVEEGHGVSRIEDIKRDIEGILKSKNGAVRKKGEPVPKELEGDMERANIAKAGPAKPEPEKSVEKPAESAKNLPARQELAKPPGKPLTDAERDAMIEDAKAKRFLSQRGSSYKVQGKERPDAHQIQRIANEHKISVEILSAVHTDAFVEVMVRAHLNGQFCDAVVHHEFKDEFLLKTMEVLNKNPEILDHWEGTEPVIKEGAKIKVKEDGREIVKDAKYFIVHSLLTWKKFSMRDARTKAAAIAEAMLLNQDFREPEEKQSEEAEAMLVQESIKNRKGWHQP